jgi:hypothetical protein
VIYRHSIQFRCSVNGFFFSPVNLQRRTERISLKQTNTVLVLYVFSFNSPRGLRPPEVEALRCVKAGKISLCGVINLFLYLSKPLLVYRGCKPH